MNDNQIVEATLPTRQISSMRLSRATELAIKDIIEGFGRHQLWRALAWHDIRQRYRRSFIGPFWLTLSMGIMVSALGFLYASIFRMPPGQYLPYLAVGLIIWGFISTLIIEGCATFINAAGIIRQIPAPLTTHVYMNLYKNIIVLLHNSIIYIVIVLVFNVPISAAALLIFPAILIYVVNGMWISIFLGLMCARFRDISMMVASLVQIMFFFTPVIWSPEIVPERQWVIEYNPFYHFLEIGRAPLLGTAPDIMNWATSLAITAIGSVVTFLLYRRYRSRIVFWV